MGDWVFAIYRRGRLALPRLRPDQARYRGTINEMSYCLAFVTNVRVVKHFADDRIELEQSRVSFVKRVVIRPQNQSLISH